MINLKSILYVNLLFNANNKVKREKRRYNGVTRKVFEINTRCIKTQYNCKYSIIILFF